MTGHHDVGVSDQPIQHRAILGHGRVQRGAPLRGVQQREQRGLGSERIAAGRLDLHHVGTGIRQQLRAVRARDTRGEVDDAHIGERVRGVHGSLGSPSARSPTMLRWIWCDPP